MTVLLIAHDGAGNPPGPQKIILDPSRGGAVHLGGGEVQSGLRHHSHGTQVMINHSRRPLTSSDVAGDDASMSFSGAVETVHNSAEHQPKLRDLAALKGAAAARRGAPA